MVDQSTDRKYVIIGNGIAGTTAAEQIRKADANARITLISNEPHSLYNRIALPPFLKNKIARQKVTIKTVAWHDERGIELLLETTVDQVRPDENLVHLTTGEELPYDALLIATGGRSNPLTNGDGLQNIFNFQSLDDALAITEQITRSKYAVTIGGSYIAYELTEAFRSRGLETTWVMRGPYFLRRILEDEGGALVDEIATKHGVVMVHGPEIAEVRGAHGQIKEVVTTDGRALPCDLLGVGLGITRNVDFLAGSGIDCQQGVMVDDTLRTNLPNVFAAGDAAEYFDRYVGGHNLMGTWDNATNQGKIAAANMLGTPTGFDEVPTYSTTLFDNRIMAFGVTPESMAGLGSVLRIDRATESYRRLFFDGDHLVGGVIIGQRKGYPKLIDLIRARTEIVPAERELLLDIQ